MLGRREADDIMAMSATDALALAERVKARAPADVRRWLLWSGWRAIKTDPIPATEKERAKAFRALCRRIGTVEIVGG